MKATSSPLQFKYIVLAKVEQVEKTLNDIVCSSMRIGNRYQDSENTRKVAMWLCRSSKPWLALGGSPGNGKTTIANAVKVLIENLAIENQKDKDGNMHWVGKTGDGRRPNVTMYTAKQLCDMAKDEPQKYAIVTNAEFLIIDDLGVEPQTVKSYGNEVSPVSDILYHRYNKSMFTLMTTNLSWNEIGTRYGERISDRMKEVMDYIPFVNKSYR